MKISKSASNRKPKTAQSSEGQLSLFPVAPKPPVKQSYCFSDHYIEEIEERDEEFEENNKKRLQELQEQRSLAIKEQLHLDWHPKVGDKIFVPLDNKKARIVAFTKNPDRSTDDKNPTGLSGINIIYEDDEVADSIYCCQAVLIEEMSN